MLAERKSDCTGCGVCALVCPKNAITMQSDREGFRYPQIDGSLCVHCALCERTCHRKAQATPAAPQNDGDCAVYAACLKQTELLDEVSSGGVFWALAQAVIDRGGVVYGVEQPSLFEVHHARAETLEQCKPFRRSKYLESDVGNAYRQVKQDLNNGRSVLFSGVGCQISALRQYLGRDDAGLCTCEVVCHGIPSMALYKLYIKELQEKRGSSAVSVNFRSKENGWKANSIAYAFSDGSVFSEFCGTNAFHCGYTNGYYDRPSCASCSSAKLPRAADVTLADFWSYRGKLLEENADRGVSLVVCSTEKGRALFAAASDSLQSEVSGLPAAIASCRHLTQPPMDSRYRDRFIDSALTHGFHKTFLRFHRRDRIRKWIEAATCLPRRAVRKLYRILTGGVD